MQDNDHKLPNQQQYERLIQAYGTSNVQKALEDYRKMKGLVQK
jgi:hypothetical protein